MRGWVSRLVIVVGALCMLIGLVGTAAAVPQDFVLAKKDLKQRRLSTDSYVDTLTVTTIADTIRTQWINTQDWSWGAFGSLPGTAASGIIGQIWFRSVKGSATMATGVQAGSDTIYFEIEKSCGDSVATGNRTIAAAVGSVALPEGGIATEPAFVGYFVVDGDTPAKNNLWLTPQFRIRYAGDTAAFKMSSCKVTIVYPQRAGSR